MKKNLTKADVFKTALHLIEQNGETTTLDVKKELRKLGFFALQADVSKFMMEIANEKGWSFRDNGIHRIYTDTPVNTNVTSQLGSLSAALRNASANNFQQAHSILNNSNNKNKTQTEIDVNDAGKMHTKRNGYKIIAYNDPDKAKWGDWIAYYINSDDTYAFPGNETRDNVRLAVRAFEGCHIHETRAYRK